MKTKQTWIIPMAGRGTRTSSLGDFKPFVLVGGEKMMYWLLVGLRSVVKADDHVVFVTTEAFEHRFCVQHELTVLVQRCVPNITWRLVIVPETPPGPAATIYATRDYVDPAVPVVCINADQFVQFDGDSLECGKTGIVPVYANFGDRSSFVTVSGNKITRIAEKEPISNLASAGVYGLGLAAGLFEAISWQMGHGIKTAGEFYVGPALNHLIDLGWYIRAATAFAKFDLGNPDGIRRFEGVVAALYADWKRDCDACE